jgi:glucokinase
MVLAGDVGGTNARLALVELDGRGARITRDGRYRSRDYPGLTPIVRRFCEEVGGRPDRASFGIACPVVGDDCTAPNLPWTINARELAVEIGIPRTTISTGGVYLAGGIAPRIVERLGSGPFLKAFRDKGRLSGLLSRIPVHVIMNPNVGLLGAAAVAGRME